MDYLCKLIIVSAPGQLKLLYYMSRQLSGQLQLNAEKQIEKVPRGIRGEKSSKDMASSRK